MQKRIEDLKVKIFADGADVAGIETWSKNPMIAGFTTNPTLMRAAGVNDYEGFAREVVSKVPDYPVSFEVFSDEFDEMHEQARQIASWGSNVYVKIPITNTRAESSCGLIRRLTNEGVKVNVTAILTPEQVTQTIAALNPDIPAYVSVFAGRIADTGRDPLPIMRQTLEQMRAYPVAELIWASPREVLNVVQADEIGCHVITITYDLLKKLTTLGRDLSDFSLDTVRMFRRDAVAAGFSLVPDRSSAMVTHG